MAKIKSAASKGISVKDNHAFQPSLPEDDLELQYIFSSIHPNEQHEVSVLRFWKALKNMGILPDDPRLKNLNRYLNEVMNGQEDDSAMITFSQFKEIINQNAIVRYALQGRLSIPAFHDFREDIEEIYLNT